MFAQNKQKEAQKNITVNSIGWLCNFLALFVTFLATGPLHTLTKPFIHDFTIEHYGAAYADVMTFVWGVICAGIIYFTSRATIATALMSLSAAIFMRLGI